MRILEALAHTRPDIWVPGVHALDLHATASAVITADQAKPLTDGLVVWDVWPVQLDDGTLASIAGGSLWVILSAPRTSDPDDRHMLARMRLFHKVGERWQDCGNLLPDGLSPGSREWSGSTRYEPETGRVTLWFTAAGRRGDTATDFEQRLFHLTGMLDLSGPAPRVTGWKNLTQTVLNDGTHYADLTVEQGVAGRIKGFRDPYWFRDPADGQGYILFTGSKSARDSQSPFDGVIGIAKATDPDGIDQAELMPPLIDADGIVNELERPHVFVQDGLYYLFWSSQKKVFAPGQTSFPTALYGMVAPALFGPWEPLNGSGLVLANPPEEPFQAYAWQVIPGALDVVSFVDYWGLKGRSIETDPALKAAQFGGTIAPTVRLALDGANSRIVKGGA